MVLPPRVIWCWVFDAVSTAGGAGACGAPFGVFSPCVEGGGAGRFACPPRPCANATEIKTPQLTAIAMTRLITGLLLELSAGSGSLAGCRTASVVVALSMGWGSPRFQFT